MFREVRGLGDRYLRLPRCDSTSFCFKSRETEAIPSTWTKVRAIRGRQWSADSSSSPLLQMRNIGCTRYGVGDSRRNAVLSRVQELTAYFLFFRLSRWKSRSGGVGRRAHGHGVRLPVIYGQDVRRRATWRETDVTDCHQPLHSVEVCQEREHVFMQS